MNQGWRCSNVELVRPGADGKKRAVLANLNAEFNLGRVTVITGATGAGKSTLLHLLGGLLRPTSGEVWASGQPLSRWTSVHRDRWRRQVGIVFQSPALLKDLSVLENVLLPMIPRASSLPPLIHAARRLLRQLDLSHTAQQTVTALSGGERQRVTVARALISQPKFITADEPTAHQDRDHAQQVLAKLRATAYEGQAAVVIAAHDARVLEAMADATGYHLDGGRLERTQ